MRWAHSKIASEMGVRYVLEGSVRRTGDDIRINARLVDGESGGNLWAERFDGAWSDVLVLQNKVVTDVATALELRLALSEEARPLAERQMPWPTTPFSEDWS